MHAQFKTVSRTKQHLADVRSNKWSSSVQNIRVSRPVQVLSHRQMRSHQTDTEDILNGSFKCSKHRV